MTHAHHNSSILASARAAMPPGAELVVANVLLSAVTVALCVGYVMMTMATSSHTIQARGIRQQILTLREEQQKLEITAVSERALDVIESKMAGLGLVPVERVEYVDANGGAVAVR